MQTAGKILAESQEIEHAEIIQENSIFSDGDKRDSPNVTHSIMTGAETISNTLNQTSKNFKDSQFMHTTMSGFKQVKMALTSRDQADKISNSLNKRKYIT